MPVFVSTHASDRLKERSNLKKASHQRMAERALTDGFHISDAAGSLRRYLDHLRHNGGDDPDRVYRVYGQQVYIFNRTILVTTIPLPRKYYDVAEKIKRQVRKEAQDNGSVLCDQEHENRGTDS